MGLLSKKHISMLQEIEGTAHVNYVCLLVAKCLSGYSCLVHDSGSQMPL